ncbi:MAG TPA: ABC transporter ATP-binding protein [Mycobacteriales bacterium]|nr:ABC transporter ATP-binding protein [Mycobacteriales bacterium]
MNALRTLWLWIVTAARAAPLMSAIMCLTTIISAVLSPLSLYGVKLTIDAVTQHTSVWPGISLAGGSLLFSTIAGTIAGPLGDTVDEKVARYVHNDLIRLTAEIPSINHHEHPELADRLSLVERDAWELGGIYRLLSTIGAVSGTITVLSMLWSVTPTLCLLLVAALAPAAIYARGLQKRNHLWRANERYRRLGHKVNDVLLEPRQGVEVRCFGLSLELLKVAGRSMDSRNRPWVAITRRYGWFTAAGWAGFGIVYAAAVAWIFHRARAGENTLGDLSLVLLIGPQISTTASTIASNIGMIMNAVQTFGRYRWLREYSAANTWAGSVLPPPDRLVDGIRFDHVDFAYPSAAASTADPKLALHDVDLHLPAGRTVAFVGENGAGKSTLVKLLARLYDPTSGAVLIDGVPLRDIDPVLWRERMSAGFQDFASLEFLAADSVGVGDLPNRADPDQLEASIAAGQAEPVIASLSAGLETQLGTQFAGGVGLSGGQWQRLALARAFMRRRPLLMLLDEPTAALDPEAEQAIYEQYGAAARELARSTGAVTILVSHRFSTVRMADLIVVVAGGGISELGSHAELLRAGGRYAELFELQARAYR